MNETSSSYDSDEAEIERSVDAFELAWLGNDPPSIVEFARHHFATGRLSLATLAELCVVDLEYRWRSERSAFMKGDPLGARPRLADYSQIFEHVGVLPFATDQLAEEYRVRKVWGDAPTLDQFLSSFDVAMPQLFGLLRAIDHELASDEVVERHFPRLSRTLPAHDSRAPLAYSDFTLHELIDAGGIGKVYQATQHSLCREVAVKALAKSYQRDPVAVDKFIEEARVLARLSHTNIVGVFGMGRFPGGGYFLVMEYVEGKNLDEYSKTRPMLAREAATVVETLANAIEHAHSQGVIHCDLKPTNVLVNRDGKLVITDFGFAALASDTNCGSNGFATGRGGTMGYTSPEWLQDDLALPLPTIDVFGLGAILNRLLVKCPNCCQALFQIRDKAMSRAPMDRYQTAGELAFALRSLSY